LELYTSSRHALCAESQPIRSVTPLPRRSTT